MHEHLGLAVVFLVLAVASGSPERKPETERVTIAPAAEAVPRR